MADTPSDRINWEAVADDLRDLVPGMDRDQWRSIVERHVIPDEHMCLKCLEMLPPESFGLMRPKRPGQSPYRRPYCNPCRAIAAKAARAHIKSVGSGFSTDPRRPRQH